MAISIDTTKRENATVTRMEPTRGRVLVDHTGCYIIEPDVEALKKDISVLNLTSLAGHTLVAAGLRTVGDLFYKENLERVPGVGPKAVKEINRELLSLMLR